MNIKGQDHLLTLVQGHSDSTFSNFFSLETARSIEAKFHVDHARDGGTKICSNGPGHMTKMTTIPIYGKNIENLPSGTKRPMTLKVDMQHRVLEYYPVCSNDAPGLKLTYFTARSNLVPYAFVWEKVKTMDFSETIVVYDIKVGRCSQLNEYMKLYEYQRSRSFIDPGPRHSDSVFLNFFSTITTYFNISSALRWAIQDQWSSGLWISYKIIIIISNYELRIFLVNFAVKWI